MLLAIDIGNTNITCAVFRGLRMEDKFNIPTDKYALIKLKARKACLLADSAVICSVVPKLTRIIRSDLKNKLKLNTYIIGKDIPVPIKNCYRNPKEVGCDRLVNAYAAILLYGAPLIAIDFGTAITFDVVSKDKEYLGGMILPGLGISLDALAKKTALLPHVELVRPKGFIGRDTKSSMLNGITYGFAAMTDDLNIRIKEKIGHSARVIGTGGNISFIKTYCRKIDIVDKDLTLKGINLLYLEYKK